MPIMASQKFGDSAAEISSDCLSDEEDGLLEPRFKYQRIEGPDAKQLMATQVVSAITAHLKLIVIGTQMGYIWIMDHFGHVDHQHVPVIRPHRSAVMKLTIDSAGNYIMSCGNDGRVAVSGVGCDELNYVINMAVMPRSIAISPTFSKPASVPMFVIAERNLAIYEKKFFKYRDNVIFSGGEKDGFISQCSWQQSLIAFTNDGGTRIYDRLSERLISLIPPSHDIDLARSSHYPPSHCWIDDTLLAIAWADTLTIAKVRTVEGSAVRRAEIHFSWHLNMFCSGVSYAVGDSDECPNIIVFGLKYGCEAMAIDTPSEVSEQTVISSSSSESKADDAAPYVQFCLFEPKNFSSYSLLAEDRLSLAANHSSQPCQFAMVGLPCYESYFLAGPSDLVMVTPYCAEDTIRWRVENGLMEEAWELACDKHAELEGTKWNSRSIGRAMIEHLISSGKPRQAAARMAEVCGSVSTEWEWAISAFERSRLCTLIAEFLPTSNPQLEPECYETALQAALYNDVDLFKRLVQQWSPDLYRTGFITGLTLKRIQEIVSSQLESNRSSQSDEIHLYQALAHLYLHERKFDSALKIYLSLKDPQIFAVIDKYQLFEQVKDQVSELMRINTDRALRLLLDNEDNVPASLVMAKIARQPKLQLAYLTKLLNKNEGAEYADQAVRLYADHDRKKLIPFLRKNENYHIRKALEICRQKNFVEEMILLFGKSGKHAEALDLVIKKYNQLDKAIEYCQEHDDTDLWARLIEEVIETPAHIAYLLNHAGSSIDPLHVIEKIPPTMPVPGLRDALVKVLRDYAAKVALQCGCQEATRGDVRELLTQHLQTQTLPVYYTLDSHCSVCGKRLVMSDPRGAELRMFGCGHIAHLSCCLELAKAEEIFYDKAFLNTRVLLTVGIVCAKWVSLEHALTFSVSGFSEELLAERKSVLEPGTCFACSDAVGDEIVS